MKSIKKITFLAILSAIFFTSQKTYAQEEQFINLVDSLMHNRQNEELTTVLIKELYQDKKYPDREIFLLQRLTQTYIKKGEYTHAKVIWNKLNAKLGEAPTLDKAKITLLKSGIYYHENNIDSALIATKQAKDIYEEINDTSGMIVCLGNLGGALAMLGQYEEGLIVLKEAIYYAEAKKKVLYELYLNTALCYKNLKNKKLELDYYGYSLQAARTGTIDSNNLVQSYYHIAAFHSTNGDIKKSQLYLDSCYLQFDHIIRPEFKDEVYDSRIANYSRLNQLDSIPSVFNAKELSIHSAILKNSDAGINEIKVALEKEQQLIKEDQVIKNREDSIVQKLLFLSLLIVTFLAFLLYKILQVKRKKINLELNVIQIEQKLLRAQLSPEFIFNSIDTIKTIIALGDNKLAADYLSKFSKLIRQILENSREKYTSLESEMSILQKYLNLKKIEKQNAFDFNLLMDPNMDQSDIYIPPMVLQPFVDQIIKINEISDQSKTQNIEILLNEKDGIIDCEISNISTSHSVNFTKEDILNSKSVKTVNQRLVSLSEEIGKISSIRIDQVKNSNLSKVFLQIPFKVNLN